jgi:hypothetical protein
MILLKLGEKRHMEMLRKGLLYMNSLAYFRGKEADEARGDRHEGTDSIIQPCDVSEFIIDPQIPGFQQKMVVAPSDLAGPVWISRQLTSSRNVFCMFAVTNPVDGPLFPKSHSWPGDSVLLFTDTQKFLSRVLDAATHRGLNVEGRLVEYYDGSKFSGELGPFRKSSIFLYQSEYRIALETGSREPLPFDIGDLSDITSEVIPLDLADDILKFRPEDF